MNPVRQSQKVKSPRITADERASAFINADPRPFADRLFRSFDGLPEIA
jgi:hypothetical protein